MQKFTLSRRNITIFFSYLFLVALFFATGYFAGTGNSGDRISKEAISNITSSPENSAVPTQTAIPYNYRVILEDSQIRLYIDEGGISRLISAENISEESYPISDITLLKKGLVFDSADGAITMMENFIS